MICAAFGREHQNSESEEAAREAAINMVLGDSLDRNPEALSKDVTSIFMRREELLTISPAFRKRLTGEGVELEDDERKGFLLPNTWEVSHLLLCDASFPVQSC